MNVLGFSILVISFSVLLVGILLVIKKKKLMPRIIGSALIVFSLFFLFLLNEARKEIPVYDYKVFKKIDSQVTHKKYFKIGITEDKTTQVEVSTDDYNKYQVGDIIPRKDSK